MVLVEYADALEFDQLQLAMKSGGGFSGFSEAPINFPPTFKYDVLQTLKRHRSVRAVISKKARHLRSARHANGGDATLDEAEENDLSSSSDSDEEQEGNSMVSSGWQSAQSKYTTDNEPSDDPDDDTDNPTSSAAQNAIANSVSHPHAVQQLLFSSPAAQRAKTKFLSLVASNPQGPTRVNSGRGTSPNITPLSINRPLARSRAKSDVGSPTSPTLGTRLPNTSLEIIRSPSQNLKPPPLNRSQSTKSANPERHEAPEEGRRCGVYDSSSKQRVPSW